MAIITAETPSLASQTGNFLWQSAKWTTGWGTRIISSVSISAIGQHLGATFLKGKIEQTPIPNLLATAVNAYCENLAYNTLNVSWLPESLRFGASYIFGGYCAGTSSDLLDWAVRGIGGAAGAYIGWAAGEVICWTANKTGEGVYFVASRVIFTESPEQITQKIPELSEKGKEIIREARGIKFNIRTQAQSSKQTAQPNPTPPPKNKGKGIPTFVIEGNLEDYDL